MLKIKCRAMLKLFACSLLVLFPGFVGSGIAADFPAKPVTLIVGFSAGGGTDTYGRAIASVANDVMGQPMVVVNKPGAGGVIAAQFVASGRPDGYTLYHASAGSFILKAMFKKLPVDPFEDFKVVGIVGKLSTGLVVPANSPFETAEELIAYAKKNPGKLRWAHTGRGNFHHVAGMGFLLKNGITAQDVPFNGGAKTRAAVVGEQVDFGFMGPQQVTGFEEQMRVLGLTLEERDKAKSEFPTFKELGIPFVEVTSPITVMAPAGISPDVLKTLSDAVVEMTQHKAFLKMLGNAGLAPDSKGSEEGEKYLLKLKEDWAPVVDFIKQEQ
ncbi:MAG: tripartite tricarboxylate transporter substrate binding protein [Desulfatiglandaceae bacterium]